MKTLIIDNYDSFTYNLVQYLEELGEKVICFRNDKVSLSKLKNIKFNRIVISPGPGRPENSGISLDLIANYYNKVPILGVCLGHQCIGHYFGAKVVKSSKIMHGKVSKIFHQKKGIFKGLASPFSATRYHSLVLEPKTLPKSLEISAKTKDNTVMAVRLKGYPVWGVQFHPESILTEKGKKILANFLQLLQTNDRKRNS